MQTIKAQAQAHNIKYNTVISRLNRGLSLEDALNNPVRTVVVSEHIRLKLDLKGINSWTIKNRVHNQGMTLDEAISKPIRLHIPFVYEDVKKLADEGFSLWSIALQLKKSPSNVCAYLKKHKIEYKRG